MINLRSKLHQRLLAYYFTNPTASHYVRELASMLSVDPTNLSKELTALEKEGLFASQVRGRQKYFTLERSYPLYSELRSIVAKTLGATPQLRNALAHIPGIQDVYLFGSFARNQQDASSDIDLLVVGRPKVEEFETTIRALERKLGRQINYTLLAPEELRKRRARHDSFLEDVFRNEHLRLTA